MVHQQTSHSIPDFQVFQTLPEFDPRVPDYPRLSSKRASATQENSIVIIVDLNLVITTDLNLVITIDLNLIITTDLNLVITTDLNLFITTDLNLVITTDLNLS